MREVILGAGPLGVSLAAELRANGRNADIYSVMGNPAYDMPGTSPTAIDGAETEAVKRACAHADVIYLCLNAHYVDWYGLYPPRLEAAVDAAAAMGAMLVYHDNVYMYRPGPEPLDETAPPSSPTRKGRLRADMAAGFLDAVNAGDLRGAIGRSPDMYGPGALNSAFNSTLGQRHFYPMLAGKPVAIVGDIDLPHTYAFVDDVARGLATLGADDRSVGRVWHLPTPPALTHRELLTLAFETAGQPPRIRGSRLSSVFMRIIGRFQADVGEVAEILAQFTEPLVVSHDSYTKTFGGSATPHRAALERTVAWYRANPGL